MLRIKIIYRRIIYTAMGNYDKHSGLWKQFYIVITTFTRTTNIGSQQKWEIKPTLSSMFSLSSVLFPWYFFKYEQKYIFNLIILHKQIWRYGLTSSWIFIVEIRQLYDRLISHNELSYTGYDCLYWTRAPFPIKYKGVHDFRLPRECS